MLQFGKIDGKALKNLIDTKSVSSILDARNKQWDDKRRIPGGILLPFDSSSEDILQAVPDKSALIVVYCGSQECPLGKKLVGRMLSDGYLHILEYSGGIKEWADTLNFPIEKEEYL